LYLGGFMGRDPAIDAVGLQQLVAQGDLRYIYSEAGNGGNQSDVSVWVRNTCQAVDGFSTNTQNTGAPDGTAQRGNLAVSLYDCAR
jgi:hypothetical protein